MSSNNTPSKLIGNTIVNGIDMVVTILFGFLVIPIFINRVGDDMLGIYSLLLLFSVTGFLSFIDLGFEGALVKFLAESEAVKNFKSYSEFYWNGNVFYAGIGLVLSGVLYTVIVLFDFFPFNVPEDLEKIAITSFGIYIFQIPFQFLSLSLGSSLKAVQKFKELKLINILFLIFNFTAIYFLLRERSDLIKYIYVFNFLYIVKCLAEFFSSVRTIPRRFRYNISINFKVISELFGYAKYLFVSKIVGLIYNQTDKLIISFFLPVSKLASFNILIKVPNLIKAVASVLNSTIVPATSSLKAVDDKLRIKTLFLRGTNLSMLIIIPLVIISIFFVKPFLVLWVGVEYAPLASLSIVLLLQFLFTQLMSIGSTMVVGSGDIKHLIPYSIAGSIINLTISLSLISYYGLTGLVVGTTVSYALISIPYLMKVLRLFEVDFKEFYLEIRVSLISFIIYFIVCFLFSLYININTYLELILSGSSLYFIYLLISYKYVLSGKDKNLVNSLLVKFKKKIFER